MGKPELVPWVALVLGQCQHVLHALLTPCTAVVCSLLCKLVVPVFPCCPTLQNACGGQMGPADAHLQAILCLGLL